MRRNYFLLFLLTVFIALNFSTYAQTNIVKKLTIDSLILRQKGMFRQIARNLLTDTLNEDNQHLSRNDEPFQEYKGRIIRHIKVQTLEFGVSISDTTKRLKNTLTRISNKLHNQTRDFVISNHLFFSENEKLSPYLLGDNEKHLRDLPFIQDAKIIVEPVKDISDSVDIVILTKDILSIGGGLNLHDSESAGLNLKDDNLFGWGDYAQIQTLYELDRDPKFGYGISYTKRNIGGSFINGSAGYLDFNKSLSSEKREESVTYLHFLKPLVNRYMQWTYGLEMTLHKTKNLYNTDSLYLSDFKYKYHVVDAWGSWNMDADKIDIYNDKDRLHRLISLRILEQRFSNSPLKYFNQYLYRYADMRAALGAISIFKQNFYKTRYIYGFGRNEDVPEGGEASITVGYTKINGRERPYAAINAQRYYFTTGEHYFNYTMRIGTSFYKSKLEDINILANVDYFSRLFQLNDRWKQRTFLSASAATQFNSLFNEPLVLESEYGMREFKNNSLGANSRITLKGESVFFSQLSFMFFRFAPFIFANASLLNVKAERLNPKFYSALGGGMRIRNESLVFGTIELKGMYFPRKNFSNESWRIEFGTRIRFKYNKEFIKKPEFVNVN